MDVSVEDGGYDAQEMLDHSTDNIETLARHGSEALYRMWLRDQKTGYGK